MREEKNMQKQTLQKTGLFCIVGLVLLAGVMGCLVGMSQKTDSSAQQTENMEKNVEKYDFFTVNADEYIQSFDYRDKSLITASAETITDADVDAKLTEVLKDYPIFNKITDRPVETGDSINIDYAAKTENTVISTETGSRIDTDNGDVLKEISASLIGRTPGESYSITVRLPDDYEGTYTDSIGNKQNLSGAKTEFSMTINYIYGAQKTIDTVTDTDISELTDRQYNNIADFKTALRQQLSDTQDAKVLQSVWESMIDRCTVIESREAEFHELVDHEYAYELDYYRQMANAGGTDLDTLAINYGYDSAESFRADIYADSEKIVRHYLIALMIAGRENLVLTDTALYASEEKLLSDYGVSTVDELEALYGETEVKLFIQLQKVDEFLKTELLTGEEE